MGGGGGLSSRPHGVARDLSVWCRGNFEREIFFHFRTRVYHVSGFRDAVNACQLSSELEEA